MTTRPQRSHPFPPAPGLALLCAGLLCAHGAWAKKAHAPRAPSAPTTAQILAPSAATVPDALPPDRLVYRCGNSYSAQPCDAGQKPLDIADARSNAQRRQSQDVTAREERLATWYEAARREREKPASAPLGSRPASAAAVCTSNIMMTCVPKKPRRRTLSAPGGTHAVGAGKSKS